MIVALEVLSILVVGWVAGAEMRAWCFVRPLVRRLPYEPQLAMEQGMLRLFGPVLAVLLPFGVVLTSALAYISRGGDTGAYWLRVAAAGCIAVTMVTTLVVNVPINTRTAAWQNAADSPEWQHMRTRWHLFQGLRAGLFTVAFVLSTVALVLSRSTPLP